HRRRQDRQPDSLSGADGRGGRGGRSRGIEPQGRWVRIERKIRRCVETPMRSEGPHDQNQLRVEHEKYLKVRLVIVFQREAKPVCVFCSFRVSAIELPLPLRVIRDFRKSLYNHTEAKISPCSPTTRIYQKRPR